jgi:hypothetical protein
MTTKSLMSDNAARATSRAVIGLQQKQAAEMRKLSDEPLRQAPKRLEHAAKTWLAMSEEQRKVVEEGTGTHELGCTGHSLNLTIDDAQEDGEGGVGGKHRAGPGCQRHPEGDVELPDEREEEVSRKAHVEKTRGRQRRRRVNPLCFHDWERLVEGRLGRGRGEATEGGKAHLEARRPQRSLAEAAPGGKAHQRH